MAMRIKKGVSIFGIRPEMVIADIIINDLCKEYGVDLVITCGPNGKHGSGSLHYVGLAEDVRSRDLEARFWDEFRNEALERLGDDFDFVIEKTHFHVEFQPK